MKHTRLERSSTAFQKFISLVLAVATLFAIAIPANAAVSDVKPGNWAYDAVQFNVENNLIAIDYSKYNMNAPAPRQDVAYAMFKLTNGKDVEPTKSVYTQYIPQDMKSSPDRYKYSVQWAVLNKLIAGTKTNGQPWSSTSYQLWFSPESIITREQMATLLYRLAEYDGLETGFSTLVLWAYSDTATISSWAKDAMCWCVTHGLMSGTGNSKLSPKGTLTYGQLAQFMMNYAKFKAECQEPDEPTPSPIPTVKPDDNTYHASYDHYEALPIEANTNGNNLPARQDYRWLLNGETDTGFWQNINIAGPWDNCKPISKDWVPEGGYKKNGHRYNKYGVCIDTVDGLPTEDEKRGFITINQHRVNNGLQPIQWDQAAQVVAEIRSLEQKALPQMAHTRPDGDSYIDPIMDECHSIGILAIKKHNGWLNENITNAKIYNHSVLRPRAYAIISQIRSKGHNDTLLASDTNYGAVSDISGYTVYNGLQMH